MLLSNHSTGGNPGIVISRSNVSHVKKRESYQILDIDIDRGVEQCNSSICNVNEKDIQLFRYHEIPDFLQGNPYVVKGYRVALPFSLCLKR